MKLRHLQMALAALLAVGMPSTATTQELLIIAPDGMIQSRISAGPAPLSTAAEKSTALQATVETPKRITATQDPGTALTATTKPDRILTVQAEPTSDLTAENQSNNPMIATADPDPDLVATAAPGYLTVTTPTPPPPPRQPEPEPVPLPAGTTVRFEDVLFAFDSAQLKPEAFPLIADFAAALLRQHTVTVRLEGHTDNRGSDAYNLALSERRAQAVLEALVSHGVDPGRLSMVGYGEQRKIAPNDTEKGRSKNRRVDAIVTQG